MTSVHVSSTSVAGLSVVSLDTEDPDSEPCLRVVETATAQLAGRLAARATSLALLRGRPPHLDLDELVADAEVLGPVAD